MASLAIDDILVLRKTLCGQAQNLVRLGLNKGTSGNCSIKVSKDLFLITPSGVSVDEIAPQSLVMLKMDGVVVGKGVPSSEWRFHRYIYQARS